jgi:hypothetical protein
VIEGGSLDGGQTQSCVFVEQSKPAAQLLGKQVGAGGRYETAIHCRLWLVAHEYVLSMDDHLKQTNEKGRIIEHVSSRLMKLITRANHV